jgi:phasin
MVLKSDPFSFSPSAFSASAFAPAGLTQISEGMRAMAETGLQQAREGYRQLRDSAESSHGALEAACHSAARGAGDYTAKMLDIARTHVASTFDFVEALLGSTSVLDAVELANAHARRQFELLATQSQDLLALGHKVAAATVEPIQAAATPTPKPA